MNCGAGVAVIRWNLWGTICSLIKGKSVFKGRKTPLKTLWSAPRSDPSGPWRRFVRPAGSAEVLRFSVTEFRRPWRSRTENRSFRKINRWRADCHRRRCGQDYRRRIVINRIADWNADICAMRAVSDGNTDSSQVYRNVTGKGKHRATCQKRCKNNFFHLQFLLFIFGLFRYCNTVALNNGGGFCFIV